MWGVSPLHRDDRDRVVGQIDTDCEQSRSHLDLALGLVESVVETLDTGIWNTDSKRYVASIPRPRRNENWRLGIDLRRKTRDTYSVRKRAPDLPKSYIWVSESSVQHIGEYEVGAAVVDAVDLGTETDLFVTVGKRIRCEIVYKPDGISDTVTSVCKIESTVIELRVVVSISERMSPISVRG